ncbi:MAG: hypothetical protein HY909_27005 [Deltaproteobacteria bacterium]|nr:hypothetical protein [Deltaproteobacteria bacterium]
MKTKTSVVSIEKNRSEREQCEREGGDDAWSAAYHHYATRVAREGSGPVPPAAGKPKVVLANVSASFANLGHTRDELAEKLPDAPVDEVFELPALARAYAMACQRVTSRASDGEHIRRRQRMMPLREAFLGMAELLAARGALDRAQVASLRSDTGMYALAQSGLGLANLYQEHWDQLRGLHPYTAEELAALREDSVWLLDHTSPKGTTRAPKAPDEARLVRDRIYAMIRERYDWLQRIGTWLHGPSAGEKIPKLLYRPPVKATAQGKDPSAGVTPKLYLPA